MRMTINGTTQDFDVKKMMSAMSHVKKYNEYLVLMNGATGPRIVRPEDNVDLSEPTSDGQSPKFETMKARKLVEVFTTHARTVGGAMGIPIEVLRNIAKPKIVGLGFPENMSGMSFDTRMRMAQLEARLNAVVADGDQFVVGDIFAQDDLDWMDAHGVQAKVEFDLDNLKVGRAAPKLKAASVHSVGSGLADQIVATALDGSYLRPDQTFDALAKRDLQCTKDMVAHAARYKIDLEGEAFIKHIANKMRDRPGQVPYVQAPSGLCFFEFPWGINHDGDAMVRIGMTYVGKNVFSMSDATLLNDDDWRDVMVGGDRTHGSLVVAMQRKGEGDRVGPIMMSAFGVDFTDGVAETIEGELLTKPFLKCDQKTMDDYISEMGPDDFLDFMDNIQHLFAATCSVLTSPKIHQVREQKHEALNKSRVKKGKVPILSHKDVIITLPKIKYEGGKAVGPAGVETRDRRGKVKHFVSFFTRLRLGRIESVSPHWRGDERLGVKLPSYVTKGKK